MCDFVLGHFTYPWKPSPDLSLDGSIYLPSQKRYAQAIATLCECDELPALCLLSPIVMSWLSPSLLEYAVYFLVLLTVICLISVIGRRGSRSQPPGPSGYPIIGSLGMPAEPVWAAYRDWGKQYGTDRFTLLRAPSCALMIPQILMSSVSISWAPTSLSLTAFRGL